MTPSAADSTIFYLPTTVTMHSIAEDIVRLAPAYPHLTTVSARDLHQYDSVVFSYILTLARRSPLCLASQQIRCLDFPMPLKALLHSYGLDTLLQCVLETEAGSTAP